MRTVLAFGVAAGLLIVTMQLVEYRFLVVERSVEIYGAIVAAAFATAGIWVGLKLTKTKVVPVEVPVEVRVEVPTPAGPFVANIAKIDELGLTPREMEVLQLIAEGLSTRQMAERLAGMLGLTPDETPTHPVALIGTPEEMATELHRRERTHGLSLLCINFASLEQIRQFGEQVLPLVRDR